MAEREEIAAAVLKADSLILDSGNAQEQAEAVADQILAWLKIRDKKIELENLQDSYMKYDDMWKRWGDSNDAVARDYVHTRIVGLTEELFNLTIDTRPTNKKENR